MSHFDYVLVIDFEATCDDQNRSWVNEVIEFPIVALQVSTGKIVDEFREYVRPVRNTRLTSFCTALTGIEQAQVDAADTFADVFARAVTWVENFQAKHPGAQCLVATCGDWDMQTMLSRQARLSAVKVPRIFTRWLNVKVLFRQVIASDATGRNVGMPGMLNALGLSLVGRHHSGLDDSRNIAAITSALIARGGVLDVTANWSPRLMQELCM